MRKNILKILPVLLAVLLLGTGTALWVSRGFTVSESESGTAQGEEDKTGKQTGAEANPKEVLRPAEEQQSRRMKTRMCRVKTFLGLSRENLCGRSM